MEKSSEHGHRFQGAAGRLRAAERIAILQPERVVAVSMKGAPVSSVLDVGTGTGLFAEAFSKTGADVTGVDVSTDLLAAAREHVPAATFVEGAAEGLPFEDGSFDLVFLGHVLHETDNPLRALEEARRVSGVRVAVLEWPYRTEDVGPPIEHRLKSEEIEGLARTAGLRCVEKLELPHADLYVFAPRGPSHA
jgi:ubiquinone/menaquinone biosynthesis C-methylase UbiE